MNEWNKNNLDEQWPHRRRCRSQRVAEEQTLFVQNSSIFFFLLFFFVFPPVLTRYLVTPSSFRASWRSSSGRYIVPWDSNNISASIFATCSSHSLLIIFYLLFNWLDTPGFSNLLTFYSIYWDRQALKKVHRTAFAKNSNKWRFCIHIIRLDGA